MSKPDNPDQGNSSNPPKKFVMHILETMKQKGRGYFNPRAKPNTHEAQRSPDSTTPKKRG